MRRMCLVAVAADRTRLKWRTALIFLGPAFAFYTVFVIVPSVKSLGWCMQRWDGLG